MTFDLILSSLFYHEKEWFVFQDILTHLPQENAAEASQRSKTTPKYTYRFGITKDWVTGDGKKDLINRHFIDSKNPGRSLIFSSVLIDAERVQELFLKSFNKKFRLKVQQFHLTLESLNSSWFEWHFDPKQKDGCVVKKTKLTVEEPNSKSNPPITASGKKQNSEDMPPILSSGETSAQSSLSLKRRRTVMENKSVPSSDNFSPSISESVLMRPRKKAKEANQSICKYLEDEKPDVLVRKEEPMSPDYKPDMANFQYIKRSSSQIEEPKINPSSLSQGTLKNDLPSSIKDNDADNDSANTPSASTASQRCLTAPQDSSHNSDSSNQNLETNSATDVRLFDSDISQDSSNIGGQDMDDIENMPKDDDTCDDTDKITKTVDGMSTNVHDITDNADNSTVDYSNSAEENSSMDEYVPDSNMLDDANNGPQSESPNSPTSSLLDNSKNIMENIKLQKQELCTEEEVFVANGQQSEQPSTSSDTSIQVDNHKHDCGAKACSNSGASSTVCLCTNAETSEEKAMAENVRNTEASQLLDGLRAAGFVPLVRKLLENVQGDTRLSQMEQELSTIGNQINQKRKANRQLQKNIKRKAGELEKLFDNLRKGKTHCEMLEQKYKALQEEKTTVEAKVKKCLEVLNSVD